MDQRSLEATWPIMDLAMEPTAAFFAPDLAAILLLRRAPLPPIGVVGLLAVRDERTFLRPAPMAAFEIAVGNMRNRMCNVKAPRRPQKVD